MFSVVPNKTLSLPKSKQTIKNPNTDLNEQIFTSKFPKVEVEWGLSSSAQDFGVWHHIDAAEPSSLHQ